MATYFAKFSTGKKGTATEHSRYDARQGKWQSRNDLVSVDYDNMPDWAENEPIRLWKAADSYERENGAAYIEAIIALPQELTNEQNRRLARELAEIIAPGLPRQLAIHDPLSTLAGVRNPHMHLMFSARKPDGVPRPPEQFFRRYNSKNPERGGCRKERGGRTPQEMGDDLRLLRGRIADAQNQALAAAGQAARVDHRSNYDRGVDKPPERHLGPAAIRRMTDGQKGRYIGQRTGMRPVAGRMPLFDGGGDKSC